MLDPKKPWLCLGLKAGDEAHSGAAAAWDPSQAREENPLRLA